MCAYQGIKYVSFSGNFAYALNEWFYERLALSEANSVLTHFAKFTEKHLYWILFFKKVAFWNPETLLKRDSSTGVLLWIW